MFVNSQHWRTSSGLSIIWQLGSTKIVNPRGCTLRLFSVLTWYLLPTVCGNVDGMSNILQELHEFVLNRIIHYKIEYKVLHPNNQKKTHVILCN